MTTDVKLVDIKVTEGRCPVCWQNNRIRKMVPIFYKMREAIYACEDTNCLYFITDNFGNLQKFIKTNGSLTYSGNVTISGSTFNHSKINSVSNRILQSTSTHASEIVHSSTYLDDILNCQSNNSDVEFIINELTTDFQNFVDNNQSKN